jgi:betaine-aldehyde dehydrogenase
MEVAMSLETPRPHVPFGHTDCLFIDGAWTRPASSAVIEVVSPTSEEIYVQVAEAGEADIHRAVGAARRAFDQGPWPRMSHLERGRYVRALGEALGARADDITSAWSHEMGILHPTAQAFMSGVEGAYAYYADLAASFRFEEPHQPSAGGEVGLLVREPVGVVAMIIPWNAPINLVTSKLAPALIAGCTAIVKASPEAPSAAYILAEATAAVGIPPGVINVLTADRAASAALVRNEGVDKVAFTGSTAAGRQIASVCGERIARYTLELGGKSAAVILDDYDIDAAADALVGPACLMNGQVCSGLTRVIVNQQRHDRLVDALSDRFRSVKIGDPFDPSSGLGPVAMRRQRDRIEGLIATGVEEGAKLAAGGGRPASLNRGFYIEPTVFGGVDNSSTLAREEIFGPVLCVIAARDDTDAVEIANDTIYGLNNSVFTNDPDKAYRVARQLRSGTVGHNNFRTDFGIAFGGFKQSGVGREGGVEGLLPYLETKTIILEGRPAHRQD